MPEATAEADGFKALGLRLHTASPFITYVYLKQHSSSASSEGDAGAVPNAVFVAGLPLGLDEAQLLEVFSCFGVVSKVVLHATKRSGVVIFASQEGQQTALAHAGTGQIVEYELPVPEGPVGLKAWVQAHKAQRPGNAVLQQQLDAWTAAHEEEEARKRKEREAAQADEGWTVVTRTKGRKRAGSASTVSGGVALAAAQAMAEGTKSIKHENFYRFQQREKRRNELVDLRRKFEEDRKRVAELRASRNFKPY